MHAYNIGIENGISFCVSCETCALKGVHNAMKTPQLQFYHTHFYGLSMLVSVLGFGLLLFSIALPQFGIRWQTGFIITLGGLSWLIPAASLIQKLKKE